MMFLHTTTAGMNEEEHSQRNDDTIEDFVTKENIKWLELFIESYQYVDC